MPEGRAHRLLCLVECRIERCLKKAGVIEENGINCHERYVIREFDEVEQFDLSKE
jgi:hypothetical protein